MGTNASQELVDVIDDEGRTLGTVTRREVRQKRLWHRCVYILVFNRLGELFVHLRTATKDVYPSHWDVTVGGVLAAGESFDDGARREVAEEIGAQVELEALFPFRYQDAASRAQAMVYRAIHDGPFRLQAEEIVRGEFVTIPQVLNRAQREPFCPDSVAVLSEYLRRAGDEGR
jgi:isopentenyldiphosphate isomerase